MTLEPPLVRWPLPPLRPKREACGGADRRSGSGQRDSNHATVVERISSKTYSTNSVPASKARRITVRSSSPLIITMTVELLTREARICRATSAPSGAGMRTSRKTACYFSSLRSATTSVLLVRKLPSIPAERRISQISSADSGSSSTARIRAGKLWLLWQTRLLEVYARSANLRILLRCFRVLQRPL